MKSPFLGMDPYIEAHGLWADFHTKLISEIERTLAAVLPERYFVQTGERSYIVLAGTDGKEEPPFDPDVVVGVTSSTESVAVAAGQVAVAEPATDQSAVTMRAFLD